MTLNPLNLFRNRERERRELRIRAYARASTNIEKKIQEKKSALAEQSNALEEVVRNALEDFEEYRGQA